MAEKVIYDIEFNGLDDARKGLENITRLQIEQQNAVKLSKQIIKEYESELSELRNEMKESGTATEEQIKREKDLTSEILKSKTILAQENDALKSINKERRTAVSNIDAVNKALNSELGSNDQLKAQLKLLTAEYNALGKEERENTDTGKQLSSQISLITEKLKENEGAIGDNRRNVGNYTESVEAALKNVNLFGVNLGGFTSKLRGVVPTMKNADKSTNGFIKSLNLLKYALVATGIGAIVIVLGALVKAFASTQRGADAFSKVLTPIKFVLSGIVGILQDLSTNLIDNIKSFGSFKEFLKNQIEVRIKSAIELFGFLGSAITKLFKRDFSGAMEDAKSAGKKFVDVTTGVENSVDKLSESLEENKERLKENYKEGQRYADMQINAEKAQIRLKTAIANTNKDLQKQRLIASDQTKTEQERIEALKEAMKLTDLKTKQEKELIRNQLDLAKLKTKQNDTDRTALLEIAELEAQLIDLEASSFSQQKQIYSQLTGLQKKIEDREIQRINTIKELIQLEEDKLEQELNNNLQKLNLIKEESQLTEDELKARNVLYENYYNSLSKLRLNSIEEEIKNSKFISTELEKNYYIDLANAKNNEEEKSRIRKEYQIKKIDELRKSIKDQIDIIKNELEPLTASNEEGLLTESLLGKDKELLENKLKDLELALAKLGYEASNIDVGVNDDGNKITDLKSLLTESLSIDDETAKGIIGTYSTTMASIQSILNTANQNIALKTEERIRGIDTAVKRGLITEEKAEAEKEKLRREQFKKQKKLQIAQATISFAEGLISAWSQAMNYVWPFNLVVGGISTAALGAAYGVNLSSIKSQNYAEGGYVQGQGTGTSDSIPAKLSNGEYVQTKKAVDYYGKDFMQAINNMELPSFQFAKGGLVAPAPINNVSSQVSKGITPLANAVTDSKVEVINIESRFSDIQNKVKNVEKRTTY